MELLRKGMCTAPPRNFPGLGQRLLRVQKFNLDTHGFRVLKGAKTAVDPGVAPQNSPAMEEAYAEEEVALLEREFPEHARFEMMNVVVGAPLFFVREATESLCFSREFRGR
jgi:hypothetical protein